MVHFPKLFHVLRQWSCVRFASVATGDVGGVDDDADDDDGGEEDEAEEEQIPLELVDSEVLQHDDAEEKTAQKTAQMSEVTNLEYQIEQ